MADDRSRFSLGLNPTAHTALAAAGFERKHPVRGGRWEVQHAVAFDVDGVAADGAAGPAAANGPAMTVRQELAAISAHKVSEWQTPSRSTVLAIGTQAEESDALQQEALQMDDVPKEPGEPIAGK